MGGACAALLYVGIGLVGGRSFVGVAGDGA